MRENIAAQFIQLLKCWLSNVWSGVVVEKNWVLLVDQCQLQVLQFSVHLTDLLSILLRYNGFVLIHSGPPNSDHHIFWDVSLPLGNALEFLLSPAMKLVADCNIKYT